MKKVAVLGAGSWGTALSIVLSDNEHDVRLWSHRQAQVDEINIEHTNNRYLDGVSLPKNIRAFNDIQAAIKEVDAIIFVVPSSAIREVCEKIKHLLPDDVMIVHASKGIEPESLKRISEIICEEIPSYHDNDIVILSGPSHAEEVALRHPTTVTVASKNENKANFAQNLFINEFFRVYTSSDVIGVELGGALKNIIALGAGISDGLGFGDNAKAALITRGLAEITRLGTAMGANPLTFLGLCGVGDLIVTSTSIHSRNWRAGNLLGKGKTLDEILSEMGMVVEGVRTTKAAYQLGKKQHVEMPITNGLYDVLFKEKDPKLVVEQLMKRDKREEMDDFQSVKL
ncbi:NAD(P)H-dependent glycerol-3-phosphate dehydrogenase [Pseudogracilibacillus auburnensis]|uniref:NAD(P)H-dependent glycerol-3-phosphate dehydrogenase n=1 Tax=Pseudogracilibacillus auburnensis TaxID=1494959 RepID=UPI001A978EC6|nr:NAD(P)H-dependent glycerol-3-phosphate dehydrogenase [Pseudogracilibacillus auburnensis]MBO1003061.1 NAD(P)H-dependent glycerol-3-phosphate dehydrogenase [Pseudogracilibacillus auburnensis]